MRLRHASFLFVVVGVFLAWSPLNAGAAPLLVDEFSGTEPDSTKWYVKAHRGSITVHDGSLPLGIWNDRPSAMYVDRVSLNPVPVPAPILLFFTGLISLSALKTSKRAEPGPLPLGIPEWAR